MERKISIWFFIFALFLSTPAFSQDDPSSEIIDESLKDISIVMATGLGGAILGLSTLSFVEEPKEHLRNILIGGSIGIIIGVGVVAWNAANKSRSMYQNYENQGINLKSWDGHQRLAWHKESHEGINNEISKNLSVVGYSFNF